MAGRGSRPHIWEDVVAMMAARQIWEGFRKVYFAAPEEARRNENFHSWLTQNYLHRQAFAIRRQTDTDRDVVSLGSLDPAGPSISARSFRDRYIERTAGLAERHRSDRVLR